MTTEKPLHIEAFGLNLTDPNVALKFGGMYQALFSGLRAAGATVTYQPHVPSRDPDVIITSPSWPKEDLEIVAASIPAPVVYYVPVAQLWFDQDLLEHYRSRILFVYGAARSEETESRYKQVGLVYHHIPLATDPSVMRPLSLDSPKLFDIVFAGGLEHRVGCDDFIRALQRDSARRQDLLICTGGEKYGIPRQTVSWGPILNLLYNLSKVGVNFHGPEQKQGPLLRWDLNNRVFDLAAAGCFQVSDNAGAMRECFRPDEVLAFDEPDAWIEAALKYCRHPEEAQPLVTRARDRVLREHTWGHRGQRLLELIQAALLRKEHVRTLIKPPFLLRARRKAARARQWLSGAL